MRRLIVAMYLLIFVDEAALFALVPLVPVYTHHLGLSKFEAGALLSVASLSIVIVSIPAGVLADRVGARRLTLAAGFLLAAANLGQAFATTLPELLIARAAFGAASATIWTATISWLSDTASDGRRASVVGAVIAVAGVGGMVGPVFAGAVAQHVSVRAVFLVIGAVALAVTLVLAAMPRGGRAPHPYQPLGDVLRASRRDRLIAAGVVMMLLGGFGDAVVNLLASLELTANGLSSSATGAVFSIAAGIFIAVSAVVARAGGRAVSVRSAGIAALLQAGSLVPVLVSLATIPVVLTVLTRSATAAWPYTIGLPLGAIGARRRGVGTGTVNGFLALAWGGANFVGAPLAGIVAGAAGDRAAYIMLVVCCLVAGAWLLRTGTEEPAPAV
ncbi:MAG: MFS transporter, partial [Gaiellales bacterium]